MKNLVINYGGWIVAALIVFGIVAYYNGWIKIGGLTIGGRENN